MAKRRGAILVATALLVMQSGCGVGTTSREPLASPSAEQPTSTPTATAAVPTWSVGDQAAPPVRLVSLPEPLVGEIGLLGEVVYWGGELRRGAGDRPGLIVGQLDGTHRLLVDLGNSPRWDGMPIISSSQRGILLVAVQRQFAWGLQTIDVERGEIKQILEFRVDLWDAVIDPDATTVYWLVGGNGTLSGVWRMSLASGAIDRVLDPDPVARAVGNRLVAAVRPGGQLAVSDDGRLAVLECFHDCRLRVVDLATGTFEDFAGAALIPQELLGFVPSGISLWGGCVLLPSGEVLDRRCADSDGAVAALEAEDAMYFGVRLPVGWILEVEPVPDAPLMSFEMRAVAVSGETGERIQLRALGALHGQ